MENKPNFLEYNTLKQILASFLTDYREFKNGYTTLLKYESFKNFHLSLVRLTFEPAVNENTRKLSSCCAKIFIKKNWGDILEIEEKSVRFMINIEYNSSIISFHVNRRILLQKFHSS